MPTSREQMAEEAAGLLTATAALREVLAHYERATKRLMSHVERGDSLVSSLEQLQGKVVRPQVTDALDEFEAARHRIRVAIFAVGLEEGATISEIGRQLGFSRQLASRLAAEATRQ